MNLRILYLQVERILEKIERSVHDFFAKFPRVGDMGGSELRKTEGILEVYFGHREVKFIPQPLLGHHHHMPLVLDGGGLRQNNDHFEHRYNHHAVRRLRPRAFLRFTSRDALYYYQSAHTMVKRSFPFVQLLLAGILLALGEPAYLFGETASLSPLEPEAAASLFDISLGGSDAELLVHGSWKLSLIGQTAAVWTDSAGLTLSGETPVIFSQTPDLYLSFMLFKKYFVLARVSSDATEIRYAAGYRGGDGEFIREIRAGNDGISFPVLPFLSLGSGSYRSFGLAASAGRDSFDGRAMLRYDQASRVTKKFVGSSEVTETVLAASAFIRGKYFVTPARSADSLEVYAQSTGGSILGSDSNYYRLLSASEYSYSASTGYIALAAASGTRVIAYYSGSASASSTVTLASAGRTCALLYDPDAYPAVSARDTELLCRYTVTGGTGVMAYVLDTASGQRDTNYEVRVDSTGFAEVTRGGVTDISSAVYHRPFSADMDYLYTTDFSSDSGSLTYAANLSKSIVVRRYSPVSQISVDTDVVEGSVEVTRNGVEDYAFTLDAKAGTLTLSTPAGLDEEITVSYLRQSSTRSAGSIAAGLGGIYSLSSTQRVWTAIGLRWSVPGTSYASAGVSNPGTVTVSAGEEEKGRSLGSGTLSHSLALAGTWKTDEAAGRYRIEGMENQGSYLTSFRALLNGGSFTVTQPVETDLAAVFPTLEAGLHSDGTTQRALKILGSSSLDSGTVSLKLVEYTGDEVPLSDFKTCAFFARRDSLASGASLSLSIDTGESGSSALSVTVPASALSTSWRRFVFYYGSGDSVLYRQTEEGGELVQAASAAAAYDSSIDGAARIVLTLSGAGSGDSVWIDEICLEDSNGGASLLFAGRAAYSDRDFHPGTDKLSVVKGFDAAASLNAGLSSSSSASGGIKAETGLGPFEIRASMRAAASASSSGISGGHRISLPGSGGLPLSFSDTFALNRAAGSFGREDKAALSLGGAGSISLGSTTTWYPSTDFGLLDQDWTASAVLAGGRLNLGLTALNTAYPGTLPSLGTGYFDSWINAFSYLLPAAESSSDRREVTASFSGAIVPGRTVLSLKGTLAGEPADAVPLRDESITARLSIPLTIGNNISVAPYYQRCWLERHTGSGEAGSGLLDAVSLACADAAAASYIYESIPFAELWNSGALSAFESAAGSAAASANLSSATYAPSLGILVSRSYGSAWYDLILPSALSAAYKRSIVRSSSSSLSDAGGIEIKASFSALNLFGLMGAYPLLKFIESDEYGATVQGTISKAASESTLRTDLIVQNTAGFYANGSQDIFSLDQRYSIAQIPSSTSWSEKLEASLSLRTKDSWLFELYKLCLSRWQSGQKTEAATAAESSMAAVSAQNGTAPAAQSAAGQSAAPQQGTASAGGRTSIVSAYLASLSSARAVCRSIFSLSAVLSSTEGDSSSEELGFDISESVEWKVVIPDRLTLSFKPSLVENRDADTGALTIGPVITLSATISF